MKFSIITVSYNSAATIADTVRTVRDQVGVEFEHIVKDGGSRDQTVDIVRELNPQAKIIVSPDAGIYDAMNQGFAEASGDIVGFLNSDDYYAAVDVLAAVKETFEQTGSDIVHGDIALVDEHRRVVRHWRSEPLRHGSLGGRQLPHPAFFARRETLLQLDRPFDPDYRISADLKQQLILVEQMRVRVSYLPKPLSIMRTGGDSTRNLRMVWLGWTECARAYREVHHRSGRIYVARKVFSKLKQLRPGRPTLAEKGIE